MHTEQIEFIVRAVLSLNETSYRLAKDLGYSNASSIERLRSGDYNINNMRLDKLKAFENYYRERLK